MPQKLLQSEPLRVGRSKWGKPEEFPSLCTVWTEREVPRKNWKNSLVRGTAQCAEDAALHLGLPLPQMYPWLIILLLFVNVNKAHYPYFLIRCWLQSSLWMSGLKVITKSKVGSLQRAQLLSVVEWRHWYARYFSSIYSAVRIFQNFTLNLLKCFVKFSDICLKILWNIYQNPQQ